VCVSKHTSYWRTGLTVDLITIEIGCNCLGHFRPETISRVAEACQVAKKTVRTLFELGASSAVSCSYRIFNARAPLVWD